MLTAKTAASIKGWNGQMDGRTDEHETDASISKMHVAKHVVSLDGL